MPSRTSFLVLLAFLLAAPVAASEVPEFAIRWAVKRHWPEPYRSHPDLLVAQCWAESRLKADAESPVGAIGICQIMPATALDLLGKRGAARGKFRGALRGKLREVKANARLAAQYMADLFRFWSYPRTAWCRWRLAVASYNAGAGNIVKAQTLSGGRTCWEDIAPFLYQVTGTHAAETLAYVFRVEDEARRRRGEALIP